MGRGVLVVRSEQQESLMLEGPVVGPDPLDWRLRAAALTEAAPARGLHSVKLKREVWLKFLGIRPRNVANRSRSAIQTVGGDMPR